MPTSPINIIAQGVLYMSMTSSTHPTTTAADSSIAVGVPMFSREQALRQLFESLPAYVETVYVADNGETNDRPIYDESWQFELSVDHLPYDCGIGPCRANIADRVTEPYLFVCDSDMEVTRENDLRLLRQVLENNADLGAIAGWLKEGDTIRTGARNLHEQNGTLIKNVNQTPEVEGEIIPFTRFDFIPQAALYRTAIFDTYRYDPEIYNSEHIDFFLGHRDADEWDFASTPAVVIQHHREIDPEYRNSQRGKNRVDFETINDKWGYSWAVPGPRSDWITNRDTSTKEEAFNLFRRATPPRVWMPVRSTLNKIGLA